MNDIPSSSDYNELSEDDLAVLRAFETAEQLTLNTPASTQQLTSDDPILGDVINPGRHPGDVQQCQQGVPADDSLRVSDDMLVLFVTEADEEIATIREALRELEQADAIHRGPVDEVKHTDATHLVALRRSAHKLKGTAGSIGYEHISAIARCAEIVVRQMQAGIISYQNGLIALTHSVQALEKTLLSIADGGREDSAPHSQLESICDSLDIKLQTTDTLEPIMSQVSSADARPAAPQSHSIDAGQLEQLVLRVEQLAEQRTSIEHAQANVERAQQELYTAQRRLQQLEIQLSTLPSVFRWSYNSGNNEPPMSSLVARILNESMRRVGHIYGRKNRARPRAVRLRDSLDSQQWDELEMSTDTQHELLVASLGEAIADVATATTQLRTALEHLSGSLQRHMVQLAVVRSDALRLPHSHSLVHGLLIRAGNQDVIVPFMQVQRIEYEKPGQYEPLFTLNALLGFPTKQVARETAQFVLLLQHNNTAVQVDAVLGEVEVLLKPLAPYLQRPGIAGTAIGDNDTVLLVLDVPGLLMHREPMQQIPSRQTVQNNSSASQTILIADDSVYIRQSVLQTLKHAGYKVMEAHDGVEALEQLLTHRIDAVLLDIEMPRLNGYELLTIIRANPLFTRLKVVMLTSRSSEKHQRHAQELGAHRYLTKPCEQDKLLMTLQSVLN